MAVPSFVRSVASGSTDTFPVPFPYLDKSHVAVSIDGVLLSSSAYTWPTDGSIKITAGNPTAGAIVERRRVTPEGPIVTFSPGNLDTSDLNVAHLQPLYLAQEADDDAQDVLGRGWVTKDFGDGATIEKGTAGQTAVFDIDGNLVPGPDQSEIEGAQGYAEAAAASAQSAAESEAAVIAVSGAIAVQVAARAGMKLLIPSLRKVATIYAEGGRNGTFTWYDGDFSAAVALDTAEGIFVASSWVAASAGCWVRQAAVKKQLGWWGVVGHLPTVPVSSMVNEYAAIQAALNTVGLTGGSLVFPGGRRFRIDTGLVARITRASYVLPPLVADQFFMDRSNFRIEGDGLGQLVAGAAMDSMLTLQSNSGAVGGVEAATPDQSVIEGLLFDGNNLANVGITHVYTRRVLIQSNSIWNVLQAAIDFAGSSAAGGEITHNTLKAPICIHARDGGGGDLTIGPNEYYFPLTGGSAVKVVDSGNITVNGGTVNSESIANVIGVYLQATSGHSVRHVKVLNMEWSGCLAGVYARTAGVGDRIYGLTIGGNHATSGAGFDRASINPGTICNLERCDGVWLGANVANGRLLSVASASAYLLTGCRSVIIRDASVTNYMGVALYAQGCDLVLWDGGDILDVGQAGAGGAVIDLDGCTNSTINPTSVTQTNAAYAQIGIIERTGSSGNSSHRTKWSGVATPWFKTTTTNGDFRRYPGDYARGLVAQTGGGATLTAGHNCSAARNTTGKTDITFTVAHPDTSYHVDVTGTQVKCYIENKTASGFRVVMLDLADNPVEGSFSFTVKSLS